MSERLRVDRIELRLRGGSAHRAREIAAQLGRALPPELADTLREAGGPASSQRVARVQAAPVRITRGAAARETAAAVARSVADTVANRGEQ